MIGLFVVSIFQSTLPCGSDVLLFLMKWFPLLFQSTLPCGSDLRFSVSKPYSIRFQSTLPCGSDLGKVNAFLFAQISIHAPLRERHKANDWAIRCVHISIHAPLRERLYITCAIARHKVFQSTLPCGSDRASLMPNGWPKNFNPRSLAGATKIR